MILRSVCCCSYFFIKIKIEKIDFILFVFFNQKLNFKRIANKLSGRQILGCPLFTDKCPHLSNSMFAVENGLFCTFAVSADFSVCSSCWVIWSVIGKICGVPLQLVPWCFDFRKNTGCPVAYLERILITICTELVLMLLNHMTIFKLRPRHSDNLGNI